MIGGFESLAPSARSRSGFFGENPLAHASSAQNETLDPHTGGVTATGETETAALVRRVLSGDREAFRPLVEEHHSAVLGLCRAVLGSASADAEDVAQEAFIRAFERLGDLEDPHRFPPWLYQIARSLCRERWRRREVERRVLAVHAERLHLESVPDPQVGMAEALGSALEELPAEERRALRLRYVDGKTYEEVGDELGLTFSQVDHLVRKARARLGRRLSVSFRCDDV